MTRRIPREVQRALEATGKPWSIEDGVRHIQVRLSGSLVAILPRSTSPRRGSRLVPNVVAQIRRAARAPS